MYRSRAYRQLTRFEQRCSELIMQGVAVITDVSGPVLTLEDGTDGLPRNVGKELPLLAM
jgi:hypothetical protein